MEKLCVFLTGLVIGLGAGVLIMMPRTEVDRALVERCRRQVEGIEAMPEPDRTRFWEITRENEALREHWAIVAAIADIKIAE